MWVASYGVMPQTYMVRGSPARELAEGPSGEPEPVGNRPPRAVSYSDSRGRSGPAGAGRTGRSGAAQESMPATVTGTPRTAQIGGHGVTWRSPEGLGKRRRVSSRSSRAWV